MPKDEQRRDVLQITSKYLIKYIYKLNRKRQ